MAAVNENSGKSNLISLLAAAVLLAGAIFLPGMGSFSKEMVSAACLILFAVLLWVRQPIPIGISSLLVVILEPLLGLMPSMSAAFAGYANPSHYFTIASFGVAIAIRKTSISARLLKKLLEICRGNAKKIIFAFMLLTYLISMIMSDIAAVVIFLAFALSLLEILREEWGEEQERRLGKVLLLSLPLASVIGGTATPMESTVNVLALNLLKDNAGIHVTFLQWCVAGLPISLVLLVAAWLILIWFYRVEALPGKVTEKFIEKIQREKKSHPAEKKILVIVGLMIVAWVAGTWVTALNTTTVAVIGLACMVLPQVNAFSWKEFRDGVPWEIPLMGGATVSLGTLAKDTGLVQLAADRITSAFPGMGAMSMVVMLGLLVTLVLLVIPVGPAAVSMLIIPVYTMAEALHLNPVMAVITVGIFASNSTILPLNAVVLMSYTKGYWKIKELAKAGIIISLLWIILAALWIPFVSGAMY